MSSYRPTYQRAPSPEVSWRRRAFLLIGLVLIAGIAYFVSHGGRHHAPAAASIQRPHAQAAPTTLTARVGTRLPAAVEDPATAADGSGSVYLIGGLSAADVSVATIDVTTGTTAHSAGSLPSKLHDAAAASIGGQVYFFGGGDLGSSDQILRVGPGTAQVGQLPVAASDVSATAVGNTAYVVGGYTGQSPLATIVAWRPGASATVVARLPRPLRYAAVAAVDGRVLIAGGTDGVTSSRDVYVFDPSTSAVRHVATLPTPLSHAAAVSFRGVAYVIGGRTSSGLASQTDQILAIDPSSGAVTPAGHLPGALSDAGTAVAGSTIVVAGGRDAQGGVHSDVLLLTPR